MPSHNLHPDVPPTLDSPDSSNLPHIANTPDTTALSGILLVNKPQGFTSHDVVAKLRGMLHIRKIGHGGTLDPLATGVLPVFLGGATKAADFAASQDKEYNAGFTLGYATDTQDVTGRILSTSETLPLTGIPCPSERYAARYAVERVLPRFLGTQRQTPPMYSAVKINGKKLYELARKGQDVERPAREITVHRLELLTYDEDAQKGRLRLLVSKGTYVRTLLHDIGIALGTLAVMHDLTRTRAGIYSLEQCHSLKEIADAARQGNVASLLLPTDSLFLSYPAVELNDEGAARAARGAIVFPRMARRMPPEPDRLCRVYHNKQFLLLGQTRPLHSGGVGLFVYKNLR